MIVEKTGDLFTSEADCLAHGVNTFGVMGKGIAVAFKQRYPDMYDHYNHVCKNTEGKDLVGEVFIWHEPSGLLIANMFSQLKPGPDARYSWTLKAIKTTLDYLHDNGYKSMAMPRVGCGIAGLEWSKMYYHIVDELNDHPIELELWSLP